LPKTRREFWRVKLDANVIRDKKNVKILRRLGWNVLTIWECETEEEEQLERTLMRALKKAEVKIE
jgi:DNA mismatch endonuclease (patch repair protein)